MKLVICLFALFVISHGAPGVSDIVDTIKDNLNRNAKAIATNVGGCVSGTYLNSETYIIQPLSKALLLDWWILLGMA